MQFTIGTITRCIGQNHYIMPLTFGGGLQKDLKLTLAELQTDSLESIDDSRDAIIARIRSALKEANAITFAQSKTALETKTFKV